MANRPTIEEYLRTFNMKNHQADYDPKHPKDVSDALIDDAYNFIVKFKEGKGTNWSMQDVRDAIDDHIQEVFDELDECDQFTVHMSNKSPEYAKDWNTVEKNK